MINLSGILKTAGAGFAAYGQEKDDAIKKALADAAAKRQAQNDAISNQIKLAGIDPAIQGKIAGAKADAGVNATVSTARQLSPIKVDEAVATAKAVQPVTVGTHEQERKIDVKNPLPVPANYTPVTVGGDPNVPGSGKVITVNTHTGKPGEVLGDSKPSASTAKLTEPQEKSYLYYNLMKNAEPDIDATLAGGKIRPSMLTAYLNSGPADAAVNFALNDDEQRLIRAARDFTAGVLRKESGAAITHDEIKQTLERYFPSAGDQGPVGESKATARKSYMHTMEQEAGPAMQFYNRQVKPPATPAPAVASHADVSDADFARAWTAGKRTDAEIAAWVAKHPGTP
jgi:hypothetical protein